METWQSQARQCLAADQDNNERTRKGEKKQSPQSKNMSSLEKGDSDPKPGDVSDGSKKVRKVKTNVQTRSMTARAARKRSEDVELDIKSREVPECKEQAEKVKTNVQTRSMTSRTPGTRPERRESSPEFIEHSKSKRHLSAVNVEVMKHILNVLKPGGHLSEHDLKPGSIYAFTRISSPGYVKIGLSKRAVEVRLDEWRRQCKYSPHQETPMDGRVIPYVAQIERLILAELSLHRRKESVCNGGAGCSKVHHEWVEVKRSLALEVIDRWSSWAETLPYDENGVLRDDWEAHTKVPVRPASRDEREQGNRWQEWIDSFPTSAPPSSEDDPSSTSANSEEQLTVPNRRKVDKRSKHS